MPGATAELAQRRNLFLVAIAGTIIAFVIWQKGAMIMHGIEEMVQSMAGTGLSEEECLSIMDDRLLNLQKIQAWEEYKKFITDPEELKKIDDIIRGLRDEVAAQDKIIAECQATYPHLKPH